ncbi:uncharacterized protein LOC136030971 isoform X2 [Artemia franciscana]|uniref:uncharacterized protein LOC136030971 isoform X2 n=1 Tax=Artemia franciscana TaxID=6661 RepID=UPI0032DBEB2B
MLLETRCLRSASLTILSKTLATEDVRLIGLLNEMADPGCPLAMKRRRKRFIAMKKQRVRFLDEEILWWRSQKVQLKREIELLELEKEKLEENLNSTLGSHFTTISSNSMRDAQTTVSSDRKLNDVGAAAPLEEDEPNPPPIAATPQETSPSSDDCPEWLKKRIKCLKEICLENVLEHSELHEKVIKLTREIAELKEMNRKLQVCFPVVYLQSIAVYCPRLSLDNLHGFMLFHEN